jgi:peptide deformylase
MSQEEKQPFNSYLEKIKERTKKSRVYSRHQMIGLMIADILEDRSHKALYMKMARTENGEKMLYMAKSIAENPKVNNKGAYFMRLWQLETKKPLSTEKPKKKSVSIKKEKMKLVTVKSKNSDILKRKAPDFDFLKKDIKEINKVISEMRKIMKTNEGVGLSANQAGLDWNMFIAEYKNKFYVFFNPKISKCSKKISIAEEGCLSVPEVSIEIERPEAITLEAFDKKGKIIKLRASGVLARIFQHETDHLNGKLITDYLS